MRAVTRDAAARFLREAGPAGAAALLRLGPEPLPAEDGMLVLGEFAWLAPRRVLLDPATGRVYSHLDGPELLAESLDGFGRLLREVASLRAGDTGRDDPVEVSRAAFERVRAYEPGLLESDVEVCAFWRAALTVWPLLHAPGPGRDGLRLDFTHEMLAADLGAERVVRIPAGNIPEVLGNHPPSRRFLIEVGLIDASPVRLDPDRPLWTAALDEFEDNDFPSSPDACRHVRLGALPGDADLVVDAHDGRVSGWSRAVDPEPFAVGTDLSTLAFALWMIARVRTYDREFAITDDYDGLAETMTAVLGVVDPVAVEGHAAFWPNVFDDRPGGLLYG